MNFKKIFGIVIVLVLGRATFYLFAPTTQEVAAIGTQSLQKSIIQNINQLLLQLKNKSISQENAQNELLDIQMQIDSYAQRPDANAATLTSFSKSISEMVPKLMSSSFSAGTASCPSYPTPLMQTLLKETNATNISEAITNIKKIKSQTPEVLKDLAPKADAFTEQDKPVIDRDLEKLFDALDATTAKEARKNIEALETSIEKKITSIAKNIQMSYRSFAENANSDKLRGMINQYKEMDFLNPKTMQALNDAIANMLYQARTDIFTMKRTLLEMDVFYRNNPSVKRPPAYSITGEAQQKEVAKISLD